MMFCLIVAVLLFVGGARASHIGSRSTMRHPSIDANTARWGC